MWGVPPMTSPGMTQNLVQGALDAASEGGAPQFGGVTGSEGAPFQGAAVLPVGATGVNCLHIPGVPGCGYEFDCHVLRDDGDRPFHGSFPLLFVRGVEPKHQQTGRSVCVVVPAIVTVNPGGTPGDRRGLQMLGVLTWGTLPKGLSGLTASCAAQSQGVQSSLIATVVMQCRGVWGYPPRQVCGGSRLTEGGMSHG